MNHEASLKTLEGADIETKIRHLRSLIAEYEAELARRKKAEQLRDQMPLPLEVS